MIGCLKCALAEVRVGSETKFGYEYLDEKDENGEVTKEWAELTDSINNLKKIIEEDKTTVKDLDNNFIYSVENVSADEKVVDSFNGTITTIGNDVYTYAAKENKDIFKTNDIINFERTIETDEDEKLSVVNTANAVSTRCSYNAEKLVSTLENTLEDILKVYDYSYDKSGNITAETLAVILKGEQSETVEKTRYTYDSENQLKSAENNTTKWTYSYDNRGNIFSKKEYIVNVDENNEIVYTEKANSNYVYDEEWKDKLTSFNGQTISYDESGNPTNYLGHSLSWTMGRQLASYDSITYAYNEYGIRTSKTSNGITTKYYLNGTDIIGQTDGMNTLYFYYDRSNEVIGFNFAGNDYIYVKNGQSDITDIANSNGEVVASYTYDPWGKITSISGLNLEIANLNPFRYRSYYYDSDIEMYYLQSRYYDPEVGRFINCDDVHYIGITESEVSYNPFAYCENELVNSFDPSGYDSFVGSYKRLYAQINAIVMLLTMIGALGAAGAANSWNPGGWIVIGGVVILTGRTIIYLKDIQKVQADLNLIASAATAATPPPPNKGGKGTQTNSKTLYNKKGYRIDVENPGNRQGQIHLQHNGNKYYYNVKDMKFHIGSSNGKLAPNSIQKLMTDKKVIKAIAKGLKILGY